MVEGPTPDMFTYHLDNSPNFFTKPQENDMLNFEQDFITVVRHYWRMLRLHPDLSHNQLFQEKYPITCGEIAMLSLRKKFDRCSSSKKT